jgi:stage II sporulation protein M
LKPNPEVGPELKAIRASGHEAGVYSHAVPRGSGLLVFVEADIVVGNCGRVMYEVMRSTSVKEHYWDDVGIRVRHVSEAFREGYGKIVMDILKPERILKSYLFILVSLFAVAFLAGFFAPPFARQQVNEIFQDFSNQFRDLAGGSLFFYILLNNVTASLLIVGSGLLLGILPVMAIFSNGVILGVVYRQGVDTLGYTNAALEVLPYGIFEIPALLIAASYGMWLGIGVFRRMRGKESALLRFQVEHAFRRYFAVVFPLLVIAAAIETFFILRLS